MVKGAAWAWLHVFVKVQWRAWLMPVVSVALRWYDPEGLWGLVEAV